MKKPSSSQEKSDVLPIVLKTLKNKPKQAIKVLPAKRMKNIYNTNNIKMKSVETEENFTEDELGFEKQKPEPLTDPSEKLKNNPNENTTSPVIRVKNINDLKVIVSTKAKEDLTKEKEKFISVQVESELSHDLLTQLQSKPNQINVYSAKRLKHINDEKVDESTKPEEDFTEKQIIKEECKDPSKLLENQLNQVKFTPVIRVRNINDLKIIESPIAQEDSTKDEGIVAIPSSTQGKSNSLKQLVSEPNKVSSSTKVIDINHIKIFGCTKPQENDEICIKSYKGHVYKISPDDKMIDDEDVEFDDEKQFFICKYCKSYYKRGADVLKHLHSSCNWIGTYVCPYCPHQTKSEFFQKLHNSDCPHRPRQKQLVKVFKLNEATKVLTCTFCKANFKTRNAMLSHCQAACSDLHTRPYKCRFCPYWARGAKKTRFHMGIKHGEWITLDQFIQNRTSNSTD